jgi:hypothetical protein
MAKATDKPRLVLNEDTMTLVNLTGYHVINKQVGPIPNDLIGFRVTAHFQNSNAVLATYTEEEHADECLKALIHYILTGQDTVNDGDKDVFKIRSIIKESNIIVSSSAEAQSLTLVKK